MLELASKAPQFKLRNQRNETVVLKEFLGKKVVLYFYPKDMTSGCTQEACEFKKFFEEFREEKAVIFGISKDSVESHQKFVQKYDLPFALLSDLDGKVCEAYGVWKEKSMYGRKYMGIERTTFVINEKGKIEAIYEKVKVKDHVKMVLQELQLQ